MLIVYSYLLASRIVLKRFILSFNIIVLKEEHDPRNIERI